MIVALVGAQYGSEGKGAVAAQMAMDFDIHVRTGAPNAGHTIYHQGVKFAMQTIPCGWVNPEAQLMIGPGGMIEMEILERELKWLTGEHLPADDRFFIDRRALILDPKLHNEGGIQGFAHHKIGSTGKGVGPCRIAHIARGTIPEYDIRHAEDYSSELDKLGVKIADVPFMLHQAHGQRKDVLLEGTQGSHLSLTYGDWPYVTSIDTNSGQLCVDAGLSPQCLTRTLLVARTFPIRVAGNSGPLYRETTWESLGLEPEITTVTKKVRRVGFWDPLLIDDAIRLNGPDCSIALMFMDYLFPEIRGKVGIDKLPMSVIDHVTKFESTHKINVYGLGTGPDTFVQLRRYP